MVKNKDTNKPWLNPSGLPDPTAYEALKPKVKTYNDHTTNKIDKIIKTIHVIVELAGFEICERVVLREKTTGKEYR